MKRYILPLVAGLVSLASCNNQSNTYVIQGTVDPSLAQACEG